MRNLKWILVILVSSFYAIAIDALESTKSFILPRSSSSLEVSVLYAVNGDDTNVKWMLNYFAYSSFLPSQPNSSVLKDTKFPVVGMKSGGKIKGIIDVSSHSNSLFSDISLTSDPTLTGVSGSPPPVEQEGYLQVLICEINEWASLLRKTSLFSQNIPLICPLLKTYPSPVPVPDPSISSSFVLDITYPINSPKDEYYQPDTSTTDELSVGCSYEYIIPPLTQSSSLSSPSPQQEIMINFELSDGTNQELVIVIVSCGSSYSSLRLNTQFSLTNPSMWSFTSQLPLYLLPIHLIYICVLIVWCPWLMLWIYRTRDMFTVKIHWMCLATWIFKVVWLVSNVILWLGISEDGYATDLNVGLQIISHALLLFSWLSILQLLCRGYGTLVSKITSHDTIAIIILSMAYATTETFYAANILYGTNGTGISVLFASWVFLVVYMESVIRTGATTTMFANDYINRLHRMKSGTVPAMTMYDRSNNNRNNVNRSSIDKQDEKYGFDALEAVYAGKLSMQRAIWLTVIIYASAKIVIQSMRFFNFVSYIPFLYLLMTEFVELCACIRVSYLTLTIKRIQVKL